MPKNCGAKFVLRYLRGVVLNPARPDFIAQGLEDVFMVAKFEYYLRKELGSGLPPETSRFDCVVLEFLWDIDPYPIHFVTHLAHAVEIIGYRHPQLEIRAGWYDFYLSICKAMHVNPEHLSQLDARLAH